MTGKPKHTSPSHTGMVVGLLYCLLAFICLRCDRRWGWGCAAVEGNGELHQPVQRRSSFSSRPVFFAQGCLCLSLQRGTPPLSKRGSEWTPLVNSSAASATFPFPSPALNYKCRTRTNWPTSRERRQGEVNPFIDRVPSKSRRLEELVALRERLSSPPFGDQPQS